MNLTKTMLIGAVSLVAIGAASPAFAGEKPGGEYFVTSYQGYGPNANQQTNARRLTAEGFDSLAWFETVCRKDLKGQRPNAVLEVATDVVTNAAGAAIGAYTGATVAFDGAVDAGKQAEYAGGAGGGGGAAAGFTNHWRAGRVEIYNCVALQIQWAQSFDGQLQGVGVIMNTRSLNGKALKRPDPSTTPPPTTGSPVVNGSTVPGS